MLLEGSPPISRIVARFSPRLRDWYRVMLGDIVLYFYFGYSLMGEPELPVSTDAPQQRHNTFACISSMLTKSRPLHSPHCRFPRTRNLSTSLTIVSLMYLVICLLA